MHLNNADQIALVPIYSLHILLLAYTYIHIKKEGQDKFLRNKQAIREIIFQMYLPKHWPPRNKRNFVDHLTWVLEIIRQIGARPSREGFLGRVNLSLRLV